MTGTPEPSRRHRLRGAALAAGAIGLATCCLGFAAGGWAFLEAYLFGYVFWLGAPLGSLAILMLHHLVGGRWGTVTRRLLEAEAGTFPVLLVLFSPIAAGVRQLYPWARPGAAAVDPGLSEKRAYLNVDFFLARAAVYFVVWIAIAHLLNRWSRREVEEGHAPLLRRLQLLSAGGLILFGLTTTFSSIDWVMSLEPRWSSTIYGAMFMVGDVLSAFVVTVLALILFLRRDEPLRAAATPERLHDLGNLLLTFVMLWAYVSFSQYLIIWSGNTAAETPWYQRRQVGGWRWVAVALGVLHLAVPFTALLSRTVKRNARALGAIAAWLLIARFLDVAWIVKPAFAAPEPSASGPAGMGWQDLAATVGIGGAWLAAFLTLLDRRPLVIPRAEEV